MARLVPENPPSLEQQRLFIAAVMLCGDTFTSEEYHTAAEQYCNGWEWYSSLGLIEHLGTGKDWRVTEKGKELLK